MRLYTEIVAKKYLGHGKMEHERTIKNKKEKIVGINSDT
jgi:hypothetical protein